MVHKRLYLMLTFISLLLVLLVGCNQETDSSSKENQSKEEVKAVNLLFSFPSVSIDPHQDSMGVRAGIAETLVKINEDLEVEPWLAESWELINETTWKFTIREGVTFHDGSIVDGEAVKASFERLIDVNEAIANNLKIKSMEVNGQDIVFTTQEPYPVFLAELVHPNASIIKSDAENITESPIGTGPFQVVDFTSEAEIQLESYSDYWDGQAKIDQATVTFNSDGNVRTLALQSGEADIAYHLPPETLEPIVTHDQLHVESISSLRVHLLLYNMASPSLEDYNVRKAIDLIINRQVIVDEVMASHATAASSPYHPDFSFSSDQEPESYDPAQAEALLKEAGYQKNASGQLEKDGEALTLTLATYQGRPELPLMAQYLQAEAASLGIDIEIVTIENIDSYLWEQQDQWDIVTYSNLTAPRGDGGYFLNVAYLPEGSLNPGGIDIPELNHLIVELNETSDIDQRTTLQKQAVTIIDDHLPQSFIVHPHIIVGVNERVKNWSPGAEEYYFLTNQLDVE